MRQKRDFKFIEKQQEGRQETQQEVVVDDGIINISKNDLINKDELEREKTRNVSRAEFQKEQMETLGRMMPNKNDRSKNNIRALAFDISGTLEADRAKTQKNFINAKKKYGW